MSCDCLCSVTLPHGAVDWSEVCDYGIPDLAHIPLSIDTALWAISEVSSY